MSAHGSPDQPLRLPDKDLLELAYVCALDAMAASEQYETMTRLDDSDASTRRRFDALVRDVRETMAVTSDTVRTPAPVELRERILDAVEETEQISTVTSIRPSRRHRWRTATFAAAAAVAVVAAGGAVAVQQTESPDSQVVVATALRSTVVGGGTMTVDYAPGDDRAVVHMDGVDAPPPGSVYQMWLIEGTPVSVGTMDAAALSVAASVPIADATALSLTVEPVGGSPFPTSGAVARVDLV